MLLPKVERTQSKLGNIQKLLQRKIRSLKKQIEEKKKQQNATQPKKSVEKDEDALLYADLEYCQSALVSGQKWQPIVRHSKMTLEEILATREKKPYVAYVDVKLMPLPSERIKQKNKKRGRNIGADENQANEDNTDVPKNAKPPSKKLTAADMKNLRNGVPLHSSQDVHKQNSGRTLPPNMKVRDSIRQSSGYGY